MGKETTGIAALSRLSEAKAMDLREVFSTLAPPADYIMPGVLSGGVVGIVGPGGVGKSFLVFNIILGNTIGDDMAKGIFTSSRPGRVLYLPNEDPADEIHRRLKEVSRYITQTDMDTLVELVEIVPLRGLNPWLMDGDGLPVHANIEWLRVACRGKRLVILDTLRRFHTGNENDSGHMTTLLGILEDISHETNCTFAFLHHTNKNASMNGNGDLAGAGRGSGVLTDNARGQFNLVGVSKEQAQDLGIQADLVGHYVQVVPAKINHGRPQAPVLLQRQPGGVLMEATMPRICDLERRMMAKEKGENQDKKGVESGQRPPARPEPEIEWEVKEPVEEKQRYLFERGEEDGYEIASPW